jgi:hypothetical protein
MKYVTHTPPTARPLKSIIAIALFGGIFVAVAIVVVLTVRSAAQPLVAAVRAYPMNTSNRLATAQLPPAGLTPGAVGFSVDPPQPVTSADGVLPDGVSIFDDTYPGVTKLNPALLQALRAAATDAADDGILFFVTSGWRSPAYQNQLLQEAVAEYGSEAEAARWVATAATSAHVAGDAADISFNVSSTWLADHGAAYGLCQIYENEPWHFELRPDASEQGCPPMYADPTQDPRMQQ